MADKPIREVPISIESLFNFEPPSYKEGVDYFYYHIDDMTDEKLEVVKDGKMVFVVYDDYDQAYDFYGHICDRFDNEIDRSYLCIMEQWDNHSYGEMKAKYTLELEEPVTIEWQCPAAKEGINLSGNALNSIVRLKRGDDK